MKRSVLILVLNISARTVLHQCLDEVHVWCNASFDEGCVAIVCLKIWIDLLLCKKSQNYILLLVKHRGDKSGLSIIVLVVNVSLFARIIIVKQIINNTSVAFECCFDNRSLTKVVTDVGSGLILKQLFSRFLVLVIRGKIKGCIAIVRLLFWLSPIFDQQLTNVCHTFDSSQT